MFYDDSVNNQAQKAAKGLFFCAFLMKKRRLYMAETKTTITEEVKNEIPRAVTQNSILTN